MLPTYSDGKYARAFIARKKKDLSTVERKTPTISPHKEASTSPPAPVTQPASTTENKTEGDPASTSNEDNANGEKKGRLNRTQNSKLSSLLNTDINAHKKTEDQRLPLTQENVVKIWNQYLESPDSPSLFVNLAKLIEPVLDGDEKVIFHIDSHTTKGFFENNKLTISNFFSNYIKAEKIQLIPVIVEKEPSQDDNLPITIKGKFEYLLKEYPAFNKLAKKLELDIQN